MGATLPLALELFGKSQPGRFFAGPTLALDIGGSTAWMAGHANPEELAGFLRFCGCRAVILDEAEAAPPAGAAAAAAPCGRNALGLPALGTGAVGVPGGGGAFPGPPRPAG